MSRRTVIVAEPIDERGVELLKRECDVIILPPGSDETTLLSLADKADGLVTRGSIKITKGFMEAAQNLSRT